MLTEFLRKIELERERQEIEEACSGLNKTYQSLEPILKPQQKSIQPSVIDNCKQLCQICDTQQHMYKCPRCQVLYCTLVCFKDQTKHGNCYEMFCKDQVEDNLRDNFVSKKLKVKTEKQMLDAHMGEDEVFQLSDERLQQLLSNIETGQEVELKPHEQALFHAFTKQFQTLWSPWWLKRETICEKIEVLTEVTDDVNLNEFDIEGDVDSGQDVEKDEFCDIADVEQTEIDTLEPPKNFRDHFLKRLKQVPDLQKIVRSPQKLAETLPYLIVSNLCSFLFYSRLYNGNLLDAEPDVLCQLLLQQLMNEESQRRVEACFESAYFDHLRHVSTAQQAPKVKQFQPQILTDIQFVLENTQLVMEAFLRYYDLLTYVEHTSSKSTRRVIGLAKQKLILYLAYVRSTYWPKDFNVQEFASYYQTFGATQKPLPERPLISEQ